MVDVEVLIVNQYNSWWVDSIMVPLTSSKHGTYLFVVGIFENRVRFLKRGRWISDEATTKKRMRSACYWCNDKKDSMLCRAAVGRTFTIVCGLV